MTVNEDETSPPSELKFEKGVENEELQRKVVEIEAALKTTSETRITVLQKFALSEGGLVNDKVRQKVWPALLGIDPELCCKTSDETLKLQEDLKSHPEYDQVVLDVKRSLKRFPPGIPYEQRVALQDQLTRLILRVITKYPHLRYYQGYHDVAVTFLLVVGEEVAFEIMERLSTDHLRECMEPTMDKTSYLLNYIFPLINRLHPSLYDFIETSGVGTMFCLPWYLTWYGHSLNHYKDVVRLYDYFLASPPMLPLYLAATIVVHRSEEIFSVDCDMANVHCVLSQLPDDLPFETLLAQATDLYKKFPPNSIEAEVKERFDKELKMRQNEDAINRRRAVRRYGRGRRLWPLFRFVPQWAMRQNPYRVLLVTTTLAVGLYAYFRSETSDFEFLPSAIR